MPNKPYVQGYLQRGAWGGVTNTERITSWEFYFEDEDGPHIYSLVDAHSESEAKRIASEHHGISESEIGVRIV